MSYDFTYAISARRMTSDRLSPSASAFARAAVQVIVSTRTALAGVIANLAHARCPVFVTNGPDGVWRRIFFCVQDAVHDVRCGEHFVGVCHVSIMQPVFTIVNTELVQA